jgi:uncharacterized protein YbjT (DUF2867 family)
MTKLKILVTGATGQQGGALARKLLKNGHKVRAYTRKPDSPGAQDLKRLGAEIFAGGFDDRKNLESGMRGMDAVFAMGTMWEVGTEGETRQGIAAADAAKAAGVKHLLYTSVGSADRHTNIPHFDSKFKVEEHIKKSGVPYTIIAPVFFMENIFAPWMAGLKEGRYPLALPPTQKLQQTCLADIAGFAAYILENRDRFLGKRFDIASDELTGLQAADILTRVTGRKIEFFEVPLEAVRAQSADFAIMFEWFIKVGYQADIQGLRRDYPQVGWHSYEEWARKQDWGFLK